MGEHGKYMNTPQTAADMNSILDALGQDNLAYWGFSYGTLLGQTYASLFPNRTGRVILDGVVNQHLWYDEPIRDETFKDTDHVLWGFYEECLKASTNCPLASVADTPEELHDMVLAFSESLKPRSLQSKSSPDVDDYTDLWDHIFSAMYSRNRWHDLASGIANSIQSNTAVLQKRDSLWDDSSPDVVFCNDGATGSENWPEEQLALHDMILPPQTSVPYETTCAQKCRYLPGWKAHRPPGWLSGCTKYGLSTLHFVSSDGSLPL